MKLVHLFLILVLGASSLLADAKIIGLEGQVYEQLPTGKIKPLAVGDEVKDGCYIITKAKSTAVLKFLDTGSKVALSPHSKMRIFSQPIKSDSGSKTTVGVIWGKVKLTIKKLIKKDKSEFNVATPVTILAVRGTEFTVSAAHDGSSHVAVQEGVVAAGVKESTPIKAGGSVQANTSELGEIKQTDYRDGETFLSEQNAAIEANPQESLDNMLEYYEKVEKDTEHLKQRTEAESQKNETEAGDRASETSKQLADEYLFAQTANTAMFENATKLLDQGKKKKTIASGLNNKMRKRLAKLNKSMQAKLNLIDQALARLDKRLDKAYKGLDDKMKKSKKSFDSKFDKLDKKFEE